MIRRLSESTILKIAAGEIIERPASIVKELVENSIDAKAQRITIKISEGGLSFLSVSDDGCGIPPKEVPLALERHTTSKIETEKDLLKVSTLGFRGEALASIASISQMEILTRTLENQEGTRVRVEGGEIKLCEPSGMPPGTTLSVSHLFFNVPARKKFLRSKNVEKNHIEKTIFSLALSHLPIEWKMEVDGKIELQAPPTQNLLERIRQIYGEETSKNLLAFSALEGPIQIQGYISNPSLHFARAQEVWFWVNQRPIQDRLLLGATLAGYRSALSTQRYPMAMVQVNLPSEMVDVNVHPTKSQVRFSQGSRLFELFSQAVSKTLQGESVSSIPFVLPASQPFSRNFALSKPLLAQEPSLPYERAPIFSKSSSQGFFSSLSILGTLSKTFILAQSQDSKDLIVIDQHAAHERIRFEKLQQQLERTSPQTQLLLVPVSIEVSSAQKEALEALQPLLKKLGFDLEEFGPKAFLLRAIPPMLSIENPNLLIQDLANDVLAEETLRSWENHCDEILSRMACHSAVRAHDSLTPTEIQNLLSQMDQAKLPSHCPHGRPTFIRFEENHLQHWFERK